MPLNKCWMCSLFFDPWNVRPHPHPKKNCKGKVQIALLRFLTASSSTEVGISLTACIAWPSFPIMSQIFKISVTSEAKISLWKGIYEENNSKLSSKEIFQV